MRNRCMIGTLFYLFIHSNMQNARGNFPFFKIGIALPLLKLHFFFDKHIEYKLFVTYFLKWEYVYLY